MELIILAMALKITLYGYYSERLRAVILLILAVNGDITDSPSSDFWVAKGADF